MWLQENWPELNIIKKDQTWKWLHRVRMDRSLKIYALAIPLVAVRQIPKYSQADLPLSWKFINKHIFADLD